MLRSFVSEAPDISLFIQGWNCITFLCWHCSVNLPAYMPFCPEKCHCYLSQLHSLAGFGCASVRGFRHTRQLLRECQQRFLLSSIPRKTIHRSKLTFRSEEIFLVACQTVLAHRLQLNMFFKNDLAVSQLWANPNKSDMMTFWFGWKHCLM